MSKSTKILNWSVASQYVDVPESVYIQLLDEAYPSVLAVNRHRWQSPYAGFGARSLMFTQDYLIAEREFGFEASLPHIVKNDQHPKVVSLFKMCESVAIWLHSDKKDECLMLDSFIRQIASQSMVVVPTHPEALRGYIETMKSIRKNLRLTEYMLRLAGYRQSIITTSNVHMVRFGEPLLFAENKQLPSRFYTTHFVTNVVTPTFAVKDLETVDVMLGSGLTASLVSSSKVSVVPGMVKGHQTTLYGGEPSKGCVDGISTLNVNCKPGYVLGRVLLLHSQITTQSYFHGLKSWDFYDNVYNRDTFIFVHPDNDYTEYLVEFLLQFDKIEYVALIIKMFGLADMINLIAGRFYFEYASAITYAVWLVSSGKFYEIAWSYLTRIASDVDIWPLNKVSSHMTIGLDEAQRFLSRVGVSCPQKFHCLKRVLLDLVGGRPGHRYVQLLAMLVMNIIANGYEDADRYEIKLTYAILRIARRLACYPIYCIQELVKRGFTLHALSDKRSSVQINGLVNPNMYGQSESNEIAMCQMQSELADFELNGFVQRPLSWAAGAQAFYDLAGVEKINVFPDITEVVQLSDDHESKSQISGTHGEATNEDDLADVHAPTDMDVDDAMDIVLEDDGDDDDDDDYVPRSILDLVNHFNLINDHIIDEDVEDWEWVFDLGELDAIERPMCMQIYLAFRRFFEAYMRGLSIDQHLRLALAAVDGMEFTIFEFAIIFAVLDDYVGTVGRKYWSGLTATILMDNVNWAADIMVKAYHRWPDFAPKN